VLHHRHHQICLALRDWTGKDHRPEPDRESSATLASEQLSQDNKAPLGQHKALGSLPAYFCINVRHQRPVEPRRSSEHGALARAIDKYYFCYHRRKQAKRLGLHLFIEMQAREVVEDRPRMYF
jgi:hypothetical protein